MTNKFQAHPLPSDWKPTTLMTALAGSQAHGTQLESSDVDVRTMFIQPTRAILSFGYQYKPDKVENADENSWELHRYIELALKNEPSVIETFKTPLLSVTDDGLAVRELFPYFLSRKRIFHCYRGNAHKQRHMAEQAKSPDRRSKCAAHYLRILFNGIELLQRGDFTVRIVDSEIGDAVMCAKQGLMSMEDVMTLGQDLEARLETAHLNSTIQEQWNLEPINEFLLSMRQKYW